MSWKLFISTRFLLAKKGQGFISLISAISVLGVSLGVAAMIIVISVMNGFEEDLRAKIMGMNAHLMIEKEGGIDDYEVLSKKLKAYEHVIGVAPYIRGSVMIRNGDRVSGVALRGIDPDAEKDVSDIYKYIDRGTAFLKESEDKIPGVVVGSELARILGVDINDKVQIISPVFRQNKWGADIPIMEEFLVEGIFSSGMYEYDSTFIFVLLGPARRLFDARDVVTGFNFKLDDPHKAADVRDRLEAEFAYPFWIRGWMDMNENLFSALKLEKTVMFIILVLIVVVAAFNIASTLIMLVMDKTREIAVLKAIGATAVDIMKIFSLQGIIIGAAGILLGSAIGLGVSQYMATHDLISLPSEIYYIDRLPVKIRPMDVLIIIITASLVSFVSSVYPAWKASRLNITEAMRYE